MSEEEIKGVNTAEVTLLLKTIASKFMVKEIYHNLFKIKLYCLSVLGTLNLILFFCISVTSTIISHTF